MTVFRIRAYQNGLEIFGFTGDRPEGEIVIPPTLRVKNRAGEIFELPVVSIGEKAFKACELLESITLPEGVREIGAGAFLGCRFLHSVTLSEGIKKIGANAFFGCRWLESIMLPSSLEKIGSDAFPRTTRLKVNSPFKTRRCKGGVEIYGFLGDGNVQVVVPCTFLVDNGAGNFSRLPVASIGERAFEDCSSLESITLPEGVAEIGASAFADCTSLKSMTLPSSLEKIGVDAFPRTTRLRVNSPFKIRPYKDGVEIYGFLGDGNVQVVVPSTFFVDNGAGNLSRLPVASIGERAFEDCDCLESITLPSSLEKIGVDAFPRTARLKVNSPYKIRPYKGGVEIYGFLDDGNVHVVVPSTLLVDNGAGSLSRLPVTGIGERAFEDCSSLESITIHEGVAEIGASAFAGCTSLKSITLPSSLEKIGVDAFPRTTRLRINSPFKTRLCMGGVEICGFLGDGKGQVVVPSTLLVDNGTGNLSRRPVASIGERAFEDCSGLESITLPEGVAEIGARAFAECTSLKSITLPSSLEKIGVDAFPRTTRLRVNSPYKIRPYKDGVEIYGFLGDGKGQVVVPSTLLVDNGTGSLSRLLVASIGERAFEDCSSLKSITLPEGVAEIGARAFAGCTSLKSITLPSSLEKIGADAFPQTTRLRINSPYKIRPYKDGVEIYGFLDDGNVQVVVPSTLLTDNDAGTLSRLPVVSIGERAFEDCDWLRSITLPEGVSEIGERAFYGCDSLQKIEISERNANYRSVDGVLYTKDGQTLVAYPGGKYGEFVTPQCVTKINAWAFVGCRYLRLIALPEGIREIGASAFWGCSWLKSITLPSSLEKVGVDAFPRTARLKVNSPFETRPYKDGVEIYGFLDDGNVQVVVPSTLLTDNDAGTLSRLPVVSIGEKAFEGCSWLESITLSEEVTEIGSNAFYGCSSLKSIVLPSSVKEIGESAFCRCSSLQKIDVSERNANYRSIDGVLYTKDGQTLVAYPEGKYGEFVTPQCVTKIDARAFAGCRFLKSITLPEGIREIGACAFWGCSWLESVALPSCVEKIGVDAFPRTTQVKVTSIFETRFYKEGVIIYGFLDDRQSNVVIPEKLLISNDAGNISSRPVVGVGEKAFKGCELIESITLPSGVRKVGEGAFYRCNSLQEIRVSEQNTSYRSINGVLYTKDGRTLVAYPGGRDGEFVIPQCVTKIKARAFAWCRLLRSITLPEGISEIGDGAFIGCESLESIILPNGITRIGDSVFKNCGSLRSITLSDGIIELGTEAFFDCISLLSMVLSNNIAEIGDSAFAGCSSLESITLPSSVEKIGESVFNECNSLHEIRVSEENTNYCSINGVLYTKDSRTLVAYPGGRDGEFVTPQCVTTIDAWAFAGCRSLRSIILPEGISEIGEGAFADCKSLGSVTLPASVRKIGVDAFPRTTRVNVTSLSFFGIRFYKNGVEICGFSDNKQNKAVISNVLLTDAGKNSRFPVVRVGKKAFACYERLESIALPEGIREIAVYAFAGCVSLKSITLPEGIREIGDGAFIGCESLESVTLPSSVEKIGVGAFPRTTQVIVSSIFKTRFYEEGVEICGFLDDRQSNVVIPEALLISYEAGNISRLPVVSVGEKAFSFYEWLESIALSEGIREIAACAFADCVSLKAIKLPEGIKEIGACAFTGCTSLESVTLPLSVKKIGADAFPRTTRVKVTSIFETRFYEEGVVICGFLDDRQSSVVIPETLLVSNDAGNVSSRPVVGVDEKAFKGCELIELLTLPSGVREVGESAFCGCNSLQEIRVSEQNANFRSINGVLYTKDGRTLVAYPGGRDGEFVIPQCVTKIKARAFAWCRLLKSITLPEGISEIGDGAFIGCESLESIILPNGITRIGDSVFKNCGSLRSITLSDGIIELGTEAFFGCESLESITLPNGITRIGDGVFKNCNSLSSITLSDGIVELGAEAFFGCDSLVSITLPNGITKISNSAFKNCDTLSSITLSDGIIEVGSKAFFGCNSLESIELPKRITKIGSLAFAGCASLTTMTLPDGILEIDDSAFAGCISLESIRLPEEITEMGNGVFIGCKSLESVTLPNGITEISDGMFTDCKSLESVIFSNGITKIGDGAFTGCKSLKSIMLPEGITVIGKGAFTNCKLLESVTLPNGITKIGDSAFTRCKSLKSITLPEGITVIGKGVFTNCRLLESVTLPNGITEIGDGAFTSCKSLKSIIFPEGIAKIGRGAFADCVSLESITLPSDMEIGLGAFPLTTRLKVKSPFKARPYKDGVEIYGFLGEGKGQVVIPSTYLIDNGAGDLSRLTVVSVGKKAFEGSELLESITLPEGVKEIGDGAFACCTLLESIRLPESVKVIGDGTFAGCTSLESIRLPEAITRIGHSAFSGCTSLESIALPEGVKEIDDGTFASCTSLKSIMLPEGITKIGHSAFAGCTSLESVMLPETIMKIGHGAFAGCTSLDSIMLPLSLEEEEIGVAAFPVTSRISIYRNTK